MTSKETNRTQPKEKHSDKKEKTKGQVDKKLRGPNRPAT